MLELKDYQKRNLEALAGYLKTACEFGAKKAFVLQTGRPYTEIAGLGDMPYVCLRVPTGGGKTFMAAHALGACARAYLQAERAVCLWLVPSNAIREQTLAALKNRRHPYRQALESHFAGQAQVMDVSEALYVQRGVLDGETVVVVCTLAALRVEDTEGRKVYESAGALHHHFTGLPDALLKGLERDVEGEPFYSLANVLRLRRPVVIMDEARNARTPLSFDTLIRFQPSCVIEFTATPMTEDRPRQGYFASNVLCQTSARELKEAEMIKLPIHLSARPDWKEVVADALQQQRALEEEAAAERAETGEYIRPLVLFQAQPDRKDRPALTVEALRQSLQEDFRIPAAQIAVATGDTRGLENVNLYDPACPIRYILTVQALKEGWDCAFAYILCSVAEQRSARSVEQVLGRVLRMPGAARKKREALNCAYAFAASASFAETAGSLKDALVESGFEKIEARDLVAPRTDADMLFAPDELNLFSQASGTVMQPPDLSRLPASMRALAAFDEATHTLTVSGPVGGREVAALQECFSEEADRQIVERLCRRLQGCPAAASAPRKAPMRVPLLAVRENGVLELFEESFFLSALWKLSECNPSLSESEFSSRAVSGQAGEIDIAESGHFEARFSQEVQAQLALIGWEPGWTLPALVNWLDRSIPHPDIAQAQSSLFIHRALTGLMEGRGFTLEVLARHKYRLRNALEAKIAAHRSRHRQEAYQQILLETDLAVEPTCSLAFDEERYAPNWYYQGYYRFEKHCFPYVGELKDRGEEFDCACYMDRLPRVSRWVRNLERRPQSSFWLQTATDRFYPDFVAELNDGRYLVVEYKGEDRWSNDDSREKRAIGQLWADRSGGQCLFIMPRGSDLAAIQDRIG